MTRPIMTPTRIAVTMGDPAGIGPEICLDLLRSQSWKSANSAAVPIVFGDASVLRRVATKLGMTFDAPIISIVDWPARCGQLGEPCVLDLGYIDAEDFTPGKVDARCGDAAYRYVIAAIDAGLAGQVNAVSTGPLNLAREREDHCRPLARFGLCDAYMEKFSHIEDIQDDASQRFPRQLFSSTMLLMDWRWRWRWPARSGRLERRRGCGGRKSD